jgi:iron(III) transport system substrate-binding protein
MGLLQPYLSPQAATIPAGMKDPEGYWTGFGARARVLIYNREKISEEELPRTLDELADPGFRGMLSMARPKTGTTLTHAGALYAVWGPEKTDAWFDRLMGNEVRWESGNGPVARSVADGIRPFGMTDTDDANGMRVDGAPVGTIFLDQGEGGLGTLVIPNTVMILSGAPHPEEARALVDYLLSPAVEARLAAGRAAQMPLQPGVAIPDHVTPVEAIDTMPVDFAAVGRMISEYAPRLAERFETGVDTGGSSNTLWIALGVLVVILVIIALAAGGRRRAASA